MDARPEGPVLAGVDGSPAARSAVRWAARYAAQRNLRLRLRYVHPLPSLVAHPLGMPAMSESTWQPAARAILDEAAETAAHAAGDGLRVGTESGAGYPAVDLIDHAAGAGTVVIGSRGLGGFTGLVIGSVGVQVAAHAPSPVVVVPPEWDTPPTGPVVVGVDGSALSMDAVAFAFDEAAVRGRALRVVSAWSLPPGVDLTAIETDLEGLGADQDRAVSESLAGFRTRYPDVPVERRVAPGTPAQLLLDAATDAGLLVVGSRGRGGFAGLVLGSVSQAALHHARCPVAVVKPRAGG